MFPYALLRTNKFLMVIVTFITTGPSTVTMSIFWPFLYWNPCLAVIAMLLHGSLDDWAQNPQYVLEALLSRKSSGNHPT